MLKDKNMKLSKREEQMRNNHLMECNKLEKAHMLTKYTKSFVNIKCCFLKIMRQYNCSRQENLERGFEAFKMRAKNHSLRVNYKAHQLNLMLNKSVMQDIKKRFAAFSQSKVQGAFSKWKDTVLEKKMEGFHSKLQKKIA